MDALERLQADLLDEKLLAFGRAMVRSEQMLTRALLCEDYDLYLRLMADCNAIAEEWNFHPELRATLLESAYENAEMGRSL